MRLQDPREPRLIRIAQHHPAAAIGLQVHKPGTQNVTVEGCHGRAGLQMGRWQDRLQLSSNKPRCMCIPQPLAVKYRATCKDLHRPACARWGQGREPTRQCKRTGQRFIARGHQGGLHLLWQPGCEFRPNPAGQAQGHLRRPAHPGQLLRDVIRAVLHDAAGHCVSGCSGACNLWCKRTHGRLIRDAGKGDDPGDTAKLILHGAGERAVRFCTARQRVTAHPMGGGFVPQYRAKPTCEPNRAIGPQPQKRPGTAMRNGTRSGPQCALQRGHAVFFHDRVGQWQCGSDPSRHLWSSDTSQPQIGRYLLQRLGHQARHLG